MPSRASCVRGLFVCLISAFVSCNLSAQTLSPTEGNDQAQPQQNAITPEQIREIQAATEAVRKSVEAHCKYSPTETNPKTIQKTNACINNAIRILR